MPYIAFYGSLMQAFPTQQTLKVQHQLQFIQPCTLNGQLYDLGDYPGLKYGAGRVKAELYEVLDPRVMAAIDSFECYDPANHSDSLYTRSCVRLAEPKVDAWVYFYNKPVEMQKIINAGDWLQFHTNNNSLTR